MDSTMLDSLWQLDQTPCHLTSCYSLVPAGAAAAAVGAARTSIIATMPTTDGLQLCCICDLSSVFFCPSVIIGAVLCTGVLPPTVLPC
jgi:hypothetical protein